MPFNTGPAKELQEVFGGRAEPAGAGLPHGGFPFPHGTACRKPLRFPPAARSADHRDRSRASGMRATVLRTDTLPATLD